MYFKIFLIIIITIINNTATYTTCKDEYNCFDNIKAAPCANLTAHVCPFFCCCSSCEKKAEHYSECKIFPYYNTAIPQLQSCAFDCSAFPYGDNQNVVAEPCDAAYESCVVCTSKDYKSCLDCFDYDDQVFSTGDNCTEEQQEFCLFFDGCPSCQSEWTAAVCVKLNLVSVIMIEIAH